MRRFTPGGEKTLNDRKALEHWLPSVERPLVFTNGCFDILHRGHVAYLERAAALGATLLVAVNSDASVRRLEKGRLKMDIERPVNPLADRLAVLAALGAVDAVIAFDDDTPLELIQLTRPDHLVKGGDWAVADIVGGKEVRGWGGEVHAIPFEFQRSTSELIRRIQSG